MKFIVNYQESYSRAELLLRTFFGIIYIAIPHLFLLALFGIWSGLISFFSWWVVLFTGKYPEGFFEFQVAYYRWGLRVSARLMNLSDGYPVFGINGTDESTDFQMPIPESLGRGLLLLRLFFAWLYVFIPHGFMLIFRIIVTCVLMFLAWWVVLFTGKYPKSWHDFNVGTMRWRTRVYLYIAFMTDDYPPFTGKELEAKTAETSNPEQK